MENVPVAFLSHASSDNAVVKELDLGLRNNGVRTLLDIRDFLGGDQLVDRVFGEGIGIADAVVVTISRQSISRPWMHDELNYATIRRIEGATRIIPFIVDDIPDNDVPAPLKHLKWVRLRDFGTVAAAADHVAAIILGTTKEPEIGPAPRWTEEPVYAGVFGLDSRDEILLMLLCKTVLDDRYHYGFLMNAEYRALAGSRGITDANLIASLHALHSKHLIETQPSFGDGGLPAHIHVNDLVVQRYFRGYEQTRHARLERAVAAAIENQGVTSTYALKSTVPDDLGRILYILKELDLQGHIKLTKQRHGHAHWIKMPTLARLLDQLPPEDPL